VAKAAHNELATILGHVFSRPDLLETAITHPSATGRNRTKRVRRTTKAADSRVADNQRLEFLGDRVLGLIVAEMLFATFPSEDEGALAKRLASLVRQDGLAHVAQDLGIGRFLILSKGEEESGGRENPATLADACEAIIGALYLDGGVDAARGFVERHWRAMMSADVAPPQDAKTALQEWAQAAGLNLPRYKVIRSEGPPHDPVFEVEVAVQGYPARSGTGRSKRAAEQAAANLLLALVRAEDAGQDHKVAANPA
jgi:ribonuclease-3